MGKLLAFDVEKEPLGFYTIKSGRFKGWKIKITIVMKSVVETGMSPDGSPTLQLNHEVISTPIPPEVTELEDNR